ncbi:hypothetical protein BH10ACI1_BH10ACI1_08370 [soil metagenome]
MWKLIKTGEIKQITGAMAKRFPFLQVLSFERARSSAFGYFQFDDVEVGETYIISVALKRFTFIQPSRVLSITDELTNVDFVAQE